MNLPTTLNTDTLDAKRVEWLRLMSHPERVRLLDMLDRIGDDRPRVSDIQKALGLTQAITSQHLLLLLRRGLLSCERAGTVRYYRLAEPAVSDLLAAVRPFLMKEAEVSTAKGKKK